MPQSPRRPPLSALLAAAALLACAGAVAAGGPPRRRVLVLNTGKVYLGAVREQTHGLEVFNPGGSVTLPRDMVRVNAPTLDDAYFQLRAELAPRDAAGRADLAAWCHTNGLSDRAREELLAALTLEPDRDDWRRTLRRVETAIAVRAARASAAEPEPAGPAPLAAAAGGVSPPVMGAFASKIEPILLARCGNATCHGRPGSGRFAVTNPSRGPVTTRKNLAAVLPFAGDGTAAGTPLLAACAGRPGRRGRTPFSGTGGAASYRLLAAWAAAVAAERPDLAHAATAGPGDADSRVTPASAEVTPGDSRPVRPDAFDPAEFNRRFAPPPTAPAVAPADPTDQSSPATPPVAAPPVPPAPDQP